jgi:RING finger protein 113A
MSQTQDIVPVTGQEEKVMFFKKRSTNKNIRKRKAVPVKSDSDDDDDSDDDAVAVSEVVTKDRKTSKNPFVQGTRKRRIKKTSEDEDDDEQDLIGTQYTADRSTTLQNSDATRYDTEWELEKKELDKKSKEAPKKDVMNAKMSVGPQRAPANLRITQRFDYQPDICKDYKETGFCGYGDTCIFLHDRGDYKTGWQLEKEWESAQKSGKSNDPNQYAISDEDDSDDELPFACLICREEFKNPVMTRCNHYFCEACAIKNYQKSPKCFACGNPTQGVFNTAKKLLEKLEQKKKRQDEGKESSDESGGFIEGLETREEDEEEDD